MPQLLSTLPFHKISLWTEAVETIAAHPIRRPGPIRRLLQRVGVPDPRIVPRLLARAGQADAVLLNGGERADMVYLTLAVFCPWIRAPHLIIDAHWQPGASPLHRFAQRLPLRLARRLLAEVQPHSPEEIPLYETVFGLPRDIVRPLPWSTSLTGYDIRRQVAVGDAIVSGGHSYRDYATLIEAVRGQAWSLWIGLPPSHVSDDVAAMAAGLPNVHIVSHWTYTEYWQAVADSRAFAMPIPPGLLRCTADQTLCNAMALGAIVVATDSMSSRLYIEHGRTGFLVPEGDADAWRRTLAEVHALPPPAAEAIRNAARHEANTRFSEEGRLRETLRRAQVAADDWAQRRQAARVERSDTMYWVKAGIVVLIAAKASLLSLIL